MSAIFGLAPQPEDSEPATRKKPSKKLSDSKKETSSKKPARSGKPQEAQQKKENRASDADWDLSRFDVPAEEGKVRFHDLDLPLEIMHAISDQGFDYCTPIQAEILPPVLEGRDTTGQAQTGTGKTAAFLIDIYTRMMRNPPEGKRRPGTPRVLILAPTRELVLQIERDARDMGKHTDFRILAVFGGIDYEKQKQILAKETIDIMIATPGRLLDFQRQKKVHLNQVEILIIDEADRMLDMGFIPDVRKIVRSTPHKEKRQTLFFSATVTPEVERLAEQWTRDPVHVEIEPDHVVAESVNQMVYIVTVEEKFALLLNLIRKENLKRVLVFTNRKDQTVKLADRLRQYRIECAVLSGDVPQKKRIQTLENFRDGKIRVLVATDVAARGLHVEGISHVINFTLPRAPEDYVHRIGRTGRAGATGISVSFACEADSFYIPDIEAYLGSPMQCTQPDSSLLELPAPEVKPRPTKKRASSRPRKGRGGRSPRKQPRRGPTKSHAPVRSSGPTS
ncbi:MAG: DEAD/DEAH box helicase [Deltaproteobacteria bacterium]